MEARRLIHWSMWLQLLAGLAFCVAGADAFVRGSARLAALAHVPPFLVGLTIVGFGTSAPELAVSVQATLLGQAGIAVGNVVGSNIFNILFVLGLSAVIAPLAVTSSVIRLHIPYVIGSGALLLGLSAGGLLSRTASILLLATFTAYMTMVVVQMMNERHEALDRLDRAQILPRRRIRADVATQVFLVAAGLAALVLGSRWLVTSAAAVTSALGVSSVLIGVTIVAVGTSVPELLTSVIAAVRGEREIAVGNVIGSNAFNTAFILGVAGSLTGRGIPFDPAVVSFELPVMIIASAACLPVFFTGYSISRWEGVLFLLSYGAYLAHEILSAVSQRGILTLDLVMRRLAIPLVTVLLVISFARAVISRSERPRRRR
jgi:cation:H+ antiporter